MKKLRGCVIPFDSKLGKLKYRPPLLSCVRGLNGVFRIFLKLFYLFKITETEKVLHQNLKGVVFKLPQIESQIDFVVKKN